MRDRPTDRTNSFADFMAQTVRTSVIDNAASSILRDPLSVGAFNARLPTISDSDVKFLDAPTAETRRCSNALTEQQINAFREAFEIFDNNGGGTIDASELQKTLADVGINIDGADLTEVMLTMDGDGNGEVDFDEFLKLMTDTEMFIEALAEKNTDRTSRKPVSKRIVLFDALTEFMKKQALRNASEIVGYYAKKYRKVAKKYAMTNKGAHVVQHYADGARLIGLTDAQLFKQLKLLKTHVNEEMLDKKELESPYAKSFHVGLLRSLVRDKQRTKIPVKPFALGGPKSKLRKHHLLVKHNLKNMRHISTVQTQSNFSKRVKIRIVGLQNSPQIRTNVFR